MAASLDKPPRRTLKVKGYVGAGGEAHYYAVNQGDLGDIAAADKNPPNGIGRESPKSAVSRLNPISSGPKCTNPQHVVSLFHI